MKKLFKAAGMFVVLMLTLSLTSCFHGQDRAAGWDFYVINGTNDDITIDFLFDSGDTATYQLKQGESFNIYRLNWIDKGLSHQKFPVCEFVEAVITEPNGQVKETSTTGHSVINYESYTYLNGDESHNLSNHTFDLIKTYVFFVTDEYIQQIKNRK